MTLTPGITAPIVPEIFNPQKLADIKYIYAESDFPEPVAGKIPLVSGTVYNIVGNVTISNQLEPPTDGNVTLTSSGPFLSSLTYTGAGAMFENSALNNGRIEIWRIFLLAPNGSVSNISGSSSGFVLLAFMGIATTLDLGAITGTACTIFFSNFQDFAQGFTFNALAGLTFSQNFVQNARNTAGLKMVEITGAHQEIQFNGNFLETSGANETILDINSESTTTGASVVGGSFNIAAGGQVFEPTGKDKTDPNWKFSGNTGVADSAVTGGSYIDVPKIIAVTALNTWTRIDDVSSGVASTWTENDVERFTFDDTTGEFTYTGLQDRAVEVIATATILKNGGGADLISIGIALNGVVNPQSEAESQNSTATVVTSVARFNISNGDKISVWTRNRSTATSIAFTQGICSIR